jgi:hypothetical protein
MKWVRCDSLDGKPGAITQSGRNKVGREAVIIKLSVTLISHRQILPISQLSEFKKPILSKVAYLATSSAFSTPLQLT